MRDFYLILNWSVTIALLGLGYVALTKNRKLALNRTFALFTVTIGIWIMASYISNDTANSPRVSEIGNYCVFLFSYVSAYLLLWFAIAMADDQRARVFVKKLNVPILFVGLINASPLVVAGVERQNDVYAIKFGPLVIVYILSLLALLIMALAVLKRNMKRSQGAQRAHLKALFYSMAWALPLLLLTEFILPALTGWFGLTNIGILAMAIPVVGLYYSVVRLKLFNLRLVVVRSLAYVVTIGLIATGYSIVSYYLTLVVQSAQQESLHVLLNAVLIIAVVNAYGPLIRIFRRYSNKLFYRDAYDPQALYHQLNKMLVSSLDVKYLMTQAISIIETAIKPDYMFLSIKRDGAGARVYTSRKLTFDAEIVQEAVKALPVTRQKVIVTDDLDEGRYPRLRELLDDHNIAVVVRLLQSPRTTPEGLGYIAFGPKKSGSPYSQEDVRVLETVANELIIAVQNALHFEEIQNFNATLQERVVEATRKLRHTNEKLKALDETKDDFISMASHQLRTPLTSVKGYLSMVLEGDAGKLTPMQQEMLGQAFFSSQRMVYLIADLLNVSRLKTGKFVIEPTVVNLVKLVNEELDQLKETAASRSLTLKFEHPETFPDLMLDETKTRQIIMNFVDNAIYYTPAGGEITVKLDETPTSVEMRVVDNGIGVPKNEQHHLFNKFYRAGNARKARPDGTGLGLFMAKKVIVGQGGSTIFESQEGKGSTFGFIFSKSKLQVQPVTTPVIEAVHPVKA